MALVIDIETASVPWESLGSKWQERIMERARRHDEGAEEETVKDTLGLSPYTAKIIVIGMLDTKKNSGFVLFDAPKSFKENFSNDQVTFKVTSEPEMLKTFWEVVKRYDEFVTYNGRQFDMPFIYIRSAINKITPTKDLMKNRYLNYQPNDAKHIDLYDQLSFYGSFRFAVGGSLDMACRAFGIDTPKDGELDGSKVSEYYHKGKIRQIAEYNYRDLIATNELFDYYRRYLQLS